MPLGERPRRGGGIRRDALKERRPELELDAVALAMLVAAGEAAPALAKDHGARVISAVLGPVQTSSEGGLETCPR